MPRRTVGLTAERHIANNSPKHPEESSTHNVIFRVIGNLHANFKNWHLRLVSEVEQYSSTRGLRCR